MSHLTTDRPAHLCLEGQFLGFFQEKGKLKYMQLSTDNQNYWIKLTKELRVSLGSIPQVGATVRVCGEWKTDRKTGAVKLKADRLSLVAEGESLAPSFSPFPMGMFPEVDEPSACEMQASECPNRNAKCPVKIMVCQKSGCQRKGGNKRQRELERILRDRNLLDHVEFRETGCLGKCSMAPNFMMMPGKKRLSGMSMEAIVALIEQMN